MCSPVATSQQVAKLACIMLRIDTIKPTWIFEAARWRHTKVPGTQKSSGSKKCCFPPFSHPNWVIYCRWSYRPLVLLRVLMKPLLCDKSLGKWWSLNKETTFKYRLLHITINIYGTLTVLGQKLHLTGPVVMTSTYTRQTAFEHRQMLNFLPRLLYKYSRGLQMQMSNNK